MSKRKADEDALPPSSSAGPNAPETPNAGASGVVGKERAESPNEKLPKPVQDARALLAKHHMEITAQNLRDLLPTKLLNTLQTTFRNKMTDFEKKKHKTENRDSQAQWLANFIIDPKDWRGSCYNSTTVNESEEEKKTKVWITQSQMGGPNYLNDAAAAKALCDSGTLASRAHEYEALAKLGKEHDQHEFDTSMTLSSQGWVESAGIRRDGDLNADEYAQVRDAMVAPCKAGARSESQG